MSEPIIAHRCPWCGVAIRDQALFCPQCGKELTQQTPTDFSATIAEPALPPQKPVDTSELAQPAFREELPAQAPPVKTRKPVIGQQALGKVGAGFQKATHVARDVEGNVAQRVQKIRTVSSVVIDEASYDASLRFVLVAVALFILFLGMLLLSKLIT